MSLADKIQVLLDFLAKFGIIMSMNNPTLYIVSTPIGNLDDISFRALEILRSVNMVLCEDTRVTQKLFSHYKIATKTTSYHEHSDEKKMKQIVDKLKSGENLALVTDAGTPGISDPGGKLVEYVVSVAPEVSVVPIPGPSAVVSALSVCGFPTDKFMFMGFAPNKNKRKKFFETLAESNCTTVCYESNHRIKKAIDTMLLVLAQDRRVCICRELTKKFETIYRGTMSEIAKMDIEEKGEFVIIVEPKGHSK